MPRIKYVGGFDAVEVDSLGVIESGQTVDVVDAKLAKSLLQQSDNWQSADKSTSKKED